MKKYHKIQEVELVYAYANGKRIKSVCEAITKFNVLLHRKAGQPFIHEFKHKNKKNKYKIWVFV
jgi:sRNA-binding regulator protein Hfq